MHCAGRDLPAERLITTEQQLLAGLAARVKRARNLCAAERSIGEQPSILARERHALFNALVDDQIADFRETINVRFTRSEIAAFDRVVKKAKHAVAIVLIIFCGVDPTLGGNAMRAARAILITERFNVVAQLAERRRRRSAGEPGANDNDFKFPAIVWRDQLRVIFVSAPFFHQWPGRHT